MRPGFHMLSRMAFALLVVLSVFGGASAEEPVKIVAGPMFTVVDPTHLAAWVQTNRPEKLGFSMKRVSRDAERLLVENFTAEIHTSAERRNTASVIVPIPPAERL